MRHAGRLVFRLVAPLIVVPCLMAQRPGIRGRVADESGAVIPGAVVTLTASSRVRKDTRASIDGSFAFPDLAPGDYTVAATAPQLVLRQPVNVTLAGQSLNVDLVLHVFVETQAVTVVDDSKPSISTEPSANATATVLRGTDLDALSDNTDDLTADLRALAGPAGGPGGGTVLIDGFSRGELPSKNAIREIRINQNPFSPEFDKLGFGRIEIFTNPGADKFHADLGYNYADDAWNSRNPYAALKAPFHLHEFRENVSGPAGKRASFSLNFAREWVDNGNAVNAVILDPRSFDVTPFTGTPVAQLRRTTAAPRVDFRLAPNHTLTVRYSYNRDIVRNSGTGGLNLASRARLNDALAHTVQVTETAVLAGAVVNETRFQYFRPRVASHANLSDPAVQVLGSFNGGGDPAGRAEDTQGSYEFQNITSMTRGTHTVRFGIRVRLLNERSVAPDNFAGTFTFSGGPAPQLDAALNPVLDASGRIISVNITSIEAYRRTLVLQLQGLSGPEIRRLGGGASQFSIGTGEPLASGSQFDAGVFIGDDWAARPNVTLSYGLRYETQNNIRDRAGFAPRAGIAWSPGRSSKGGRGKTVLRAGFGVFYERFDLANVLLVRRYDGVTHRQYVVTSPDFFPIAAAPPFPSGVALAPTIRRISPALRPPLLAQTAVSYERQLPSDTTVAVTWSNAHGARMFRSIDANAPAPGPEGAYPLGRPGLTALMESTGRYNQNQVIVNVNSKAGRNVSLTGSYAYGRAMSDTDGLGAFPASPYSMDGEYGPAATDMRHRATLGGTLPAPWGVRLNPLLTCNTGPPFDITTGRDLYGNTLFNARPALASDASKPGVAATPYGLLDLFPRVGDRMIPRNFGRGPGQIMLNLRVGRTFTFGSRERHAPAPASLSGGPGGIAREGQSIPFSAGGVQRSAAASRRYSLTASLQIRNLTNHNNPGPIIGNVTSPLFGRANQPAGSGSAVFSENANNRRLELQMRLTF